LGKDFSIRDGHFACVAGACCAWTPETSEMTNPFRTLVRDESGATAIEYALIASLVAMVIISGVSGIGLKLSSYFSEVSSAMK
jgi:pilus assembly protein Flp/PilA